MNPMYRTNDQRICTGIVKLMCRTYHSMFSPNESNVQNQWNLCTNVLKLMCQLPHSPTPPLQKLAYFLYKFSIKHFCPISKTSTIYNEKLTKQNFLILYFLLYLIYTLLRRKTLNLNHECLVYTRWRARRCPWKKI